MFLVCKLNSVYKEGEGGYLIASVLVEKKVTFNQTECFGGKKKVTFNQTENRHKGLSVKQAVTISDLPTKEGKQKTRIMRMFEFQVQTRSRRIALVIVTLDKGNWMTLQKIIRRLIIPRTFYRKANSYMLLYIRSNIINIFNNKNKTCAEGQHESLTIILQ